MSAVWALGDESQRRDDGGGARGGCEQAIAHLTETVPTVRRRYGGQVVEEPAREVVAAEYLHTTARGVLEGDAPDPQLHSHVVVTSAVREDGRIVAVASRPIFRAAREVGAYYRSALAHELRSGVMRSRRGPASTAATSRSPVFPEGCWRRSLLAAVRSRGPRSASARSGVGRPSAGSCAG